MEQQAGINSTVESGEGSVTSRLCGSLAKLINSTPGTVPELCRQPQTATFREVECAELTQASGAEGRAPKQNTGQVGTCLVCKGF